MISWIIKFSTSDNAILVFWLVHCISVTSHYTCVWPYMEINAANVKLFVRSQVLSTKKWMRKETNSASFPQENYKKLRTMPSQKQRKGRIVQNKNIQRYVSVKFPVAKFQIWKLRFYAFMKITQQQQFLPECYRMASATPGGTKFLKPIEEMSKAGEELNVFLKKFYTSARKKDRTLSV